MPLGARCASETTRDRVIRCAMPAGAAIDERRPVLAAECASGRQSPVPGRDGTRPALPGLSPQPFWSDAISARAAATSSSFVWAWPQRPQPPGAASVRRTQVRRASDGSPAAWTTSSVSCSTTASCLSRSSAPAFVRTWTRTWFGSPVDVRDRRGRQLVDEGRGVLAEHRDLGHRLDPHDGRGRLGRQGVRIARRSPRGHRCRSSAWRGPPDYAARHSGGWTMTPVIVKREDGRSCRATRDRRWSRAP